MQGDYKVLASRLRKLADSLERVGTRMEAEYPREVAQRRHGLPDWTEDHEVGAMLILVLGKELLETSSVGTFTRDRLLQMLDALARDREFFTPGLFECVNKLDGEGEEAVEPCKSSGRR